jgi:hypothetical protein
MACSDPTEIKHLLLHFWSLVHPEMRMQLFFAVLSKRTIKNAPKEQFDSCTEEQPPEVDKIVREELQIRTVKNNRNFQFS